MTKQKLPKGLLELASYYSGDSSWENFTNCLDVDNAAVATIVNDFNVHQTVARALEWHIGLNRVESWLNKNVKALYGYKPLDLLQNYENGEICVREILRRMH